MEAITYNGSREGHLAIKYTSFCSTETMTKYNKAQYDLVNTFLKPKDNEKGVTIEDFERNLRANGVTKFS